MLLIAYALNCFPPDGNKWQQARMRACTVTTMALCRSSIAAPAGRFHMRHSTHISTIILVIEGAHGFSCDTYIRGLFSGFGWLTIFVVISTFPTRPTRCDDDCKCWTVVWNDYYASLSNNISTILIYWFYSRKSRGCSHQNGSLLCIVPKYT